MFLLARKKEMVGIDLGSSSIKLVQLKSSKGKYALENIGVHPLPPETIVDNTIMNSSAVVDSLKTLIREMGVKTSDVAAGLSGNSVIIKKIMTQSMLPEELEEQIQWEAEQHIPFDIKDVNVDFQILGPDAADPSKMHVLLVASKKDVVNEYVTVFAEAGLRLTVLDVDSFALQNAFELAQAPPPEDTVALINIGASLININIIRDGISLFTRDVQMGGQLYTDEIQKNFGVGSAEAESIKLRKDHPDRNLLEEIFGRVNDTLTNEIKRSLDFFSANSLDTIISHVYLSGGASRTPLLKETIEQRLDLPVEFIDPFRNISVDAKLFDQSHLEQIAPLVVVAVGLATRRIGDK